MQWNHRRVHGGVHPAHGNVQLPLSQMIQAGSSKEAASSQSAWKTEERWLRSQIFVFSPQIFLWDFCDKYICIFLHKYICGIFVTNMRSSIEPPDCLTFLQMYPQTPN